MTTPLAPPVLSPDERASMRAYWLFYEPINQSLQDELLPVIAAMPEIGPLVRAMSPEVLARQQERSLSTQRAALLDGNWESYLADLYAQGVMYAKQGMSFSAWLEIISVYRNAIRHRLAPLAREDMERATMIGSGLNRFMDIGIAGIGEAYLATKEEIITRQQEAIREISTPVLQVREQVLIIPVVGVVDTHRARVLTENLLGAIRLKRARGVVMDITGVPIVDSKVANHIVQACEAARLMGALVVLTGISPEIAQTLVAIGAELRGVRTVGDLQGGIEEVETLLGHRAPAAGA